MSSCRRMSGGARWVVSLLFLVSFGLSLAGIHHSSTVVSSHSIRDNDAAMLQPANRSSTVITRKTNIIEPRMNDDLYKISRSDNESNTAAAAAAAASPTINNSTQPHLEMNTSRSSSFSICLLLKDDNDILNEWIAYYYHAWNLRHLIVGVDPKSRTSPSALFQTWRDTFLDLQIDEWSDRNYMPQEFLKGNFQNVPSFLPPFMTQNVSASIFHTPHEKQTLTQEQLQYDLQQINHHRYRQATFVSHCMETLRNQHDGDKQRSSWVAHVDSDEFMVINPKLRARTNAVKKIQVPSAPFELLSFLEQMFVYYPKRLQRTCVMMPTLLFGSIVKDDDDDDDYRGDNITTTTTTTTTTISNWNVSKLETLHWKHHANWTDIVNGMQKAMVDVSVLPANHAIFQEHRIKSVHQPLEHPDCRRMALKPEVDAVRLFPFTINHYIGSFARYLSRNDRRRNLDIYQKKANVNGGVDKDGWMDGWLEGFVQQHGMERVSKVLGDYLITH